MADIPSADRRGWGRPCSGRIVTITPLNMALPVRAEVAPLFEAFIAECVDKGFRFNTRRDDWGYMCLAAETLVMTPEGEVPIGDLAGTTARVLTRGVNRGARSRWVEAEVRSFGVQPLRRITLTRNGAQREVYATPEHRWFVDNRHRVSVQERTSDQLLPDDLLTSCHPVSAATRMRPSPLGVTHGITYGDGTLARSEARVALCGPKNWPLARYFSDLQPRATYRDPNAADEHILITGLPRFFKRLPSVEEAPAYLYGFLAGYFAADGDVQRNGRCRLWSVDKDALEAARLLFLRLGITTSAPVVTKRTGMNGIVDLGDGVNALWHIAIAPWALDSEFFLIPSHRERWNAAPKRYQPAKWRVVSVEETERLEEVYCAVVPGTETFALADNLLTGNCRHIRSDPSLPWSNHAWGLAVDLDATQNPYMHRLHTTFPGWVADLANRYGLRWGGDYTGSYYDPMHFEVTGTPADVRATVARLRAQEDDMDVTELRREFTVPGGPVRLGVHDLVRQAITDEFEKKGTPARVAVLELARRAADEALAEATAKLGAQIKATDAKAAQALAGIGEVRALAEQILLRLGGNE